MIDTKISRYKITEKIGEGGMASVWRAEDPNLGRDIALKFLPESLARSDDARKRFLREAKAASILRHSGIATVFDAGESDGRIFIAFELVDGETVSERISRGPLDVDDACRVAFDAAEALDHAHECGVVHRDVTSRNIMINKKGQVIVEKAIELDSEFAQAYVGLGAAQSNRYARGWGGQQVLRDAEASFLRALELEPTSTAARRGLIRVYWEQGRSEDVLVQGREALRPNPDGVDNLLAMAEAYLFGGLPEKAVPVLRRVIEFEPASEAAHYFLLWAYYNGGGDPETMIDAGETYFRKFGGNVEAYFWVGVAYHALGDTDAAVMYEGLFR